MNSSVVYEAFAVGFKEGFKIGIVWLVFYSYLDRIERKGLIKPFYGGVFAVVAISVAALFLKLEALKSEYLGNIISMSFAFFLVASAGALLHVSGVDLLWGKKPGDIFGKTAGHVFINSAIFVLAVIFFSPDAVGSILFLRELFLMREAGMGAYLPAFFGFLMPVPLIFISGRYLKYRRVGSFFDMPQLLLFLSIVKLLGGGIKGLAEISLIPSVQAGIMKFMHDFIHQMFVFIMVPDHLLLTRSAWNFIGFFFGSNFGRIASLIILVFLPMLFIYYSLLKPVPEPDARTGAERRKLKYLLLSDRRRKALPVIFFISLISISWFSQGGEAVSRLYMPKPRPVVEDKGSVIIPLSDPTMDLMDGSLHKFSLTYKGEELRIAVIKKSNNALAVCLDACEICSPEGYGQREENVVCVYCNTPIPIDTLGEPGGCNPIPLTVSINEKFIRISLEEIIGKWEYAKKGGGREGIK